MLCREFTQNSVAIRLTLRRPFQGNLGFTFLTHSCKNQVQISCLALSRYFFYKQKWVKGAFDLSSQTVVNFSLWMRTFLLSHGPTCSPSYGRRVYVNCQPITRGPVRTKNDVKSSALHFPGWLGWVKPQKNFLHKWRTATRLGKSYLDPFLRLLFLSVMIYGYGCLIFDGCHKERWVMCGCRALCSFLLLLRNIVVICKLSITNFQFN